MNSTTLKYSVIRQRDLSVLKLVGEFSTPPPLTAKQLGSVEVSSPFEQNRSMIFNPLIIVASELGLQNSNSSQGSSDNSKSTIVKSYKKVDAAGIGSVIVDGTTDEQIEQASAEGAYTVRTDLGEISRTHNYRSASGAERIAITVNRFDRYYTHDIVVAVPDDMPELQPHYLQGLMYGLASTEVGIASLVAPLEESELHDPDVVKAVVNWDLERQVHPLEGSKVGTLVDIRRDAGTSTTENLFRLIPINAWRRGCLDKLVEMPPSEREIEAGTDLVRALDAGFRIDVVLVYEDMKVLITPEEVRGDEIEG